MKLLEKLKTKIKAFFDKMYKKSINNLQINECFGNEKLTEEDVKELMQLIDEKFDENNKR